MAIFQLQLQLTDAYFPVITGFQLQLLLTGITLWPTLMSMRSFVSPPSICFFVCTQICVSVGNINIVVVVVVVVVVYSESSTS